MSLRKYLATPGPSSPLPWRVVAKRGGRYEPPQYWEVLDADDRTLARSRDDQTAWFIADTGNATRLTWWRRLTALL